MPDRMPVTLHMFDHARFVAKVYPSVDPLDYSTINLKSIELNKQLGENGILGIWVPSGPFNQASLIYDLTDLYTLYMTDYPLYEKLMSFSMERILGYAKVMKEANPDVLIVGGNVPGGFVGPQVYDQYILPFEKQYIDYCQEGGIPAMYHNCGQIMSLLESYKKLGVCSVEPFSPPPGGDADMVKAKEIVDGEYVMVGGVDKLELLLHGTVDQVKKEVAGIANIVKPGGNHILQNADSLEYETPIENVRVYVETAIEHAWY